MRFVFMLAGSLSLAVGSTFLLMAHAFAVATDGVGNRVDWTWGVIFLFLGIYWLAYTATLKDK